jgi:hypothetical protein
MHAADDRGEDDLQRYAFNRLGSAPSGYWGYFSRPSGAAMRLSPTQVAATAMIAR